MDASRYCFSCGAYLKGGATDHRPGCEILRLIREAVKKKPEPAKEKGDK